MTGPLCPISIHWSPFTLLKFQMAPRFTLLMSSGSKKEPRYTCLSEAKASHPQSMWFEVSSSAPHLLHSGLSDSHIRSPQGIMSSEKASNSPELSPVKGQKPSLGTQTGSRNWFLNLSSSVTKTLPLYPMLVNELSSNPSSYILPRDSQDRLRSYKLQSCVLWARQRSRFLVPQHVQGPNTAPQHAG
jgi:hypothetical protein